MPPVAAQACPSGDSPPESCQIHCLPLLPKGVPVVISSPKDYQIHCLLLPPKHIPVMILTPKLPNPLPFVVSQACPSSDSQPESYQLVPVVIPSPKVTKSIASRCLPSVSQWWFPARKLPNPLPPVASQARPSSDSQTESYQIHCLPLLSKRVPVVIPSPKVTKSIASRCLPSVSQ